MPKISKTTNPTGLRELAAGDFTIRLLTPTTGARSFWLERFDYSASGLPAGTEISCVAHAGSAEEFFRLGTVEAPNHTPNLISELSSDRPLKFRFLFNAPNLPKLLAFADNIRAADESGTLGDSLVDIEPTDLGGVAWRLDIPRANPGADRPVLQVERSLFPTAQAAANDVWLGVLVMPEVMRQICRVIVDNIGEMDECDTWIGDWKDFIEGLGVPGIHEDADDTAKTQWIEDIVATFCAKTSMRAQFKRAEAELNGEKI